MMKKIDISSACRGDSVVTLSVFCKDSVTGFSIPNNVIIVVKALYSSATSNTRTSHAVVQNVAFSLL